MSDLSEFQKAMSGGGSRPSKYEVIINFPTILNVSSKIVNLLRHNIFSTTSPDYTNTTIDVPYKGRQLPFVGEAVNTAWQTTIREDVYLEVREVFERWINIMSNRDSTRGEVRLNVIHGSANVRKLTVNGNLEKEWSLVYLFPDSATPINLDHSDSSNIVSHVVSFRYWYPITSGPITLLNGVSSLSNVINN